jgi:tetratricopeptide (TPR) repeat protein
MMWVTTETLTDRRTLRRLSAAEGYLMLDMHEHALRELRGIADPGSEVFRYYLLRAMSYRGLGDFHTAIDDYRQCQRLQPDDLDVLMGFAWCYKRIDDLSQSIAMMHEAYRTHPQEPIVLYNLSCYYSLAGQKSQALSWLGRALRMQPDLRRLVPEETDFDAIRSTPEFAKLLDLSV